MLSDFFRINLPYGLIRNENGEWMAFNREYRPLGFNTTDGTVPGLPVYTRYKGLTDKLIREITGNNRHAVNLDENGEIKRFWLYNDSTNPMNQGNKQNKYWDIYWKKLQRLASLWISTTVIE
ncbi:MAG: hypothetical protein LBL07_12895 [Tannerella sp.]|jgi:hypothetical protein|nr:hypothetical protein [Tannerella sp.]